MRIANAILIVVAILAAGLASESVFARGGGHGARSGGHSGGSHFGRHHFRGPRVHLGIIVGAPLGYYAPPYYYAPYYPPDITALPSPPVYIEQESSQSAPAQSQHNPGFWYFCAESQAYYPYVKECPTGWQRVAPQPPPG